MRRVLFIIFSLLCLQTSLWAQFDDGNGYGNYGNGYENGNGYGNGYDQDPNNPNRKGTWGRDTSKVDRTVPTEYYQWHIDERLGTITRQEFNDTLPHLFQNMNATDGYRGEYNILGNLGSPRYARNFLDRKPVDDFMFMNPYDYFHTTPGSLLFTNTKSPVTNLSYHECGSRENGQDRFRAYFATNINKQAGLGFKVDYLYGRGYYNNQANSQLGGTIFGYYLSDHYDMHAMVSWEHTKMGENGGITDDAYITNPSSFPRSVSSKDIPTNLSDVYNRNDHRTLYVTHRYNLGSYREIEVPDSLKPVMPEDGELLMRITSDSLLEVIKADSLRLATTLDSLRNQWQFENQPQREFIPVTSFVHTLHIRRQEHTNYNRSSISEDYFGHAPYIGTSYGRFGDETYATSIKNTFGVQLREGFNKWAKAGVTLFAAHEYERYKLLTPETTDTEDVFENYNRNHVSFGGEIQKTQGTAIHYKAGAEFWAIGPKAGDMVLQGTGDLNFRLGKDTVRLSATAFFKNLTAPFYYRHYHSHTLWWDNNGLDQETRTRIEGTLSLDRTLTSLRFGVENISNYTHLAVTHSPNYNTDGTVKSYGTSVEVRQQAGSIQVMSATLKQGLHWGIFHWDNEVTWQHSSNGDVLPLPMVSVYTNPYISFRIAKVLLVELGGDMRFFTDYYAPDYAPFINQFAVQDASQERMKIGNYPIINGYVNLAIKRVRGYVNFTHANQGTGRAFWAPHYPIDPYSVHIGLSWTFYD